MERYIKAFKVGDLFERSKKHTLKASLKKLTTSPIKTKDFPIANITSSKLNNGIVCYLEDIGEVLNTKKNNSITIADLGYSFYQNDYFVSSGHNFCLNVKSINLKNKLDENKDSYKYLVKLINDIYINKFHSFYRYISYGNDFAREYIVLPVVECAESLAIWHEVDGTPLTLDIPTIEDIMQRIEEHKRVKTINLYIAEKEKYIAEKEQYIKELEEKYVF